MKKYLFVIIGVFLVFAGCQRSDICGENKRDTPKLLIKFYNSDNEDLPQPVEGFNARFTDSTSYYFDSPVSDTVAAIPLNTNKEATTYEFTIHLDDSTNVKSDTITFTYKPEEIYINRACGFRDRYTHFDIDELKNNADSSWIKKVTVLQPDTIENEQDPHLYIYH